MTLAILIAAVVSAGSHLLRLGKILLNVREAFRNQPHLGIVEKNQKADDLGLCVFGNQIQAFCNRKYKDPNTIF